MVEGYIGSPLDPLFVGLAAGIYLLFGVALWWSLRYLRAGPSAAVVGVITILLILLVGISWTGNLVPDLAVIGWHYILTAGALATEFYFAGWGR